jgi:predicted metal-dependent hydrolase
MRSRNRRHEQNRQEQEEVSSTQTMTVDDGPQIAALAEEVKGLRETVNILVSQITMLRSEVSISVTIFVCLQCAMSQIQMLRSEVKRGNATVNKTFYDLKYSSRNGRFKRVPKALAIKWRPVFHF